MEALGVAWRPREGPWMAQHPVAVGSEMVVSGAVMAAIPQVVTQRTSSAGTRNGLVVGTVLGLGSLAAWIWGKRGSFVRHIGVGGTVGSGAWFATQAAAAIDAGLQSNTAAAVQVQQEQLLAAQAAQVQQAFPVPIALPQLPPQSLQMDHSPEDVLVGVGL